MWSHVLSEEGFEVVYRDSWLIAVQPHATSYCFILFLTTQQAVCLCQTPAFLTTQVSIYGAADGLNQLHHKGHKACPQDW